MSIQQIHVHVLLEFYVYNLNCDIKKRYFIIPWHQHLLSTLERQSSKGEVVGSNPAVVKNFSFYNSRFLRIAHSSQLKSANTNEINLDIHLWWWWWRWFNERTVKLRTFPLIPSPTGPHPARGDSGHCMCIHVCLVWYIFPTAFIVPHHLPVCRQLHTEPVCRQLHTDSPAQLDSIWTWRNAHEVGRSPHRGLYMYLGRQIRGPVLY